MHRFSIERRRFAIEIRRLAAIVHRNSLIVHRHLSVFVDICRFLRISPPQTMTVIITHFLPSFRTQEKLRRDAQDPHLGLGLIQSPTSMDFVGGLIGRLIVHERV